MSMPTIYGCPTLEDCLFQETEPFSEMSMPTIYGCPTLEECLRTAIIAKDVAFVKEAVAGTFGDLQDAWLQDAFLGAGECGHACFVDILLDANVPEDPLTTDWDDQTAFIKAVKLGHIKFVEILLLHGFPMSDHDEVKALYCACESDAVDMLMLLLEHFGEEHINVVRWNGTETLLTITVMARKQNCKEMVKLLLDAGADVNMITYLGCTALHLAVSNNDLEVVNMLLEANGDVNHKNESGVNSFWLANFQQFEMIKLLLQYGADPTPIDSSYRKLSAEDVNPGKPYISVFLDVFIQSFTLLFSACTDKDLQSILHRLKSHCNIPEVMELLHEVTCKPRSLKSSCRLAVRGAMRVKRPDDVQGLPLPQKLKDYLLFSDICI